jgi:hypothetical protein
MQKTEFLTIFGTYDALPNIQETLPSVIEETKRAGAALIVHDSTEHNRLPVWDWLQDLNRKNDFFLILSSNMSMAHARNMCLQLGSELYAPDYICAMEDDHGFRPGLIPEMISAMREHYGKPAPNGLKYGLFTACRACWPEQKYHQTPDGHAYPDANSPQPVLGGANSCFRCAPASHWNAVLKGYDPDEYPISGFQTGGCCFRNYHNGFTTMVVRNGSLIYSLERTGRGVTRDTMMRLYDHHYTASDRRSRYWGKPRDSSQPSKVDAAAIMEPPQGASVAGFSTLERGADGSCWRWALGPESKLVVDAAEECDAVIDLEFMNPIEGQIVQIACNGVLVAEIRPAPGELVSQTVPVRLQPGYNWLVFRYADWNAYKTLISGHDQRPIAVRFTRLNVIGASVAQSALAT